MSPPDEIETKGASASSRSDETVRGDGRIVTLVVDDEEMLRTMLARELPRRGYAVETAATGEDALRLATEMDFAVAVVDIRMPGLDGVETLRRLRHASPDIEVILLTGHGTIEGAVEGMRAGAFDYLTKPARLDELTATIDKAVEHRALRRENAALRRITEGRGDDPEFVAESRPMRDLVDRIEKIAPSSHPVLIQGESGTGKELVARAIHRLSKRRSNPFVVINSSAIPDPLFESELFGHRRGAFTGASDRRLGLMEAADGGTLFLDEIAEMNASVQAKMLRALESGEIRRIGENRATRVDVRVVAATNRDLEAEVAAGRFRDDLFYRLNTIVLKIPPLRERRADVEPLVRYFVALAADIDGVAPEALDVLRRHDWKGNVRELKNALESAALIARDRRIDLEDLPEPIRRAPNSRNAMDGEIRPLDEVLADYVRRALDRFGGNKSQTARELGIDPKTLYRHLRKKR